MNPTENMLIRARVDKTDDQNEQQAVEMTGRADEKIGGPKHPTHRAQGYPISSHLPKGSIALVMMMNGNPDQAVLLGGEHPEHRPKDLAEGEWKLYDQWGKSLHATEDGWVMTVGKLTIVADTVVIQSGDIRLGGEDASRPVAAQGTVDSSGDVLVSNFLTCVKGK